MRYIAVAIAALSALRVSDAASMCNPSVTGMDTADRPRHTNKIFNGDFGNGLDGFNTSGSVEHIPLAGQDGCEDSDGVIQMIAVPKDEQSQSVHPTDSSDSSETGGVEKRDTITSSSVSTDIKSLTVGTNYTVEFFYYVVYSPKANICRIQAYWDNLSIGNSSYFPAVLIIGGDWVEFNATATATKTTGTLKLVIACSTGTAQVYIDDISATKKAVASSSTTSSTTVKATSSTATSKPTSTGTSTQINVAANAAFVSVSATSSSGSSTTSKSTTVTSSSAGSTSTAPSITTVSRPTTTTSAGAGAAAVAIAAASSAAASSAAASSAGSSSSSSAAGGVGLTTVVGAVSSAAGGVSSAATSVAGAVSSAAGVASSAAASAAASAAGAVSSAASSVASGLTASGSSSSAASSSTSSSSNAGDATVDSTVLIIAADSDTASTASLGLLSYGIPYEIVIRGSAGPLPSLNSSSTQGNYGSIIIMSSIAVSSSSGWGSALTDDQWTALYTYQTSFNVRMVRLNEYPGSEFGTTPVGPGCCDGLLDQTISFTDVSDFPTANINKNAGVSTLGLWHVPATITDTSTTKQVAKFGITTGFTSDSVAGVINNFSDGREQFVWFIGWAPAWSLTSNFLQHAHIHWMTRGLFLGKRKIHLSCQIDDVQLATELYYPANSPDFKIEVADLEAHVTWQKNLAGRLPAGSEFWLEFGHNGNGDIIDATLNDTNSICNPEDAVYYDMPNGTALEFQKDLGTGVDIWPTGYETYSWSKACAGMDEFSAWFKDSGNLNQFAHVSHTFSHLSLNNATTHDATREIKFNQAWLTQVGIDQATKWSPHGIIPPAITGLHNGDAIKAWMDNGIIYVVGDNTRPVLRNTDNPYWPLISTVAANGYAGLTIVPRFSTAIYFNCHTMECTLNEWIATSAGKGTYFDLLASSKASTVRNLLALQSDPYMFHQANMHQTTVDSITIGTQTGKMSLVSSWTETMVQEMMRLTNWPMTSLTHDNIAHYFLDRKTLDGCNAKLSYTYSSDGNSVKAVTVTADGNKCAVPVPVTIPSGSATASGGSLTSDVVGSEPPIQWVTLAGSPVTLTLSSPVSIG
ncbi:hypothetical protein G7Z17_g337 [Cylindrodendrum hubeiense]|uniref:Extracellular serine-rich protein n=1 Tax=Cylindrodendrum hubeiense TaxID=595255 RepID=A0A9P5LGG5_9HYPO|nr:hypothetical protein G7Z17_g337 [Cylindrodendrum hubeiense]